MVELTTIQLTKETKKRLDKHGIRKETYDAILNKLVDSYEKIQN